MNRMWDKPGRITLALALLVMLTQSGGIVREVFDWDESTFILISSRLLDGHLPYLDLFDNKPPLIFFMLAGMMAVFGEHLMSIRLFGDVCILALALLTVAVLRRFVPSWPAVLSGSLLVAIFAIDPGQHTGTELPAMAMILGALALLLSSRDKVWAIAGAGVLISLATLTRTNLAVVAVAIGAWIFLAGQFFPKTSVRPWAIVPYTIGGLVPVFVFLAIYWQANALDTFILATWTVPLSYANNQSGMLQVLAELLVAWGRMAQWFPLWIGTFTLLTLAGCLTLVIRGPRACAEKNPAFAQELGLIISFAGAVLVSVLMSGAAYMHYALHILPFAAMLSAPLFAWAWPRATTRWLVVGLVCVSVLSSLRYTTPNLVKVLTQSDFIMQSWTLRKAADQIAEVRQPEDEIWALNNHLILWYLDQEPVSRVTAHPSNITRPSIINPLTKAGYIEDGELQRIYDSHPAFLITDKELVPFYMQEDAAYFEAYVEENYTVFFEAHDVVVYRRRGHQG